MPITYYQHCRCPACHHQLDAVATTIPTCPACNKPLDATAVWSTRQYPGQVTLPGWLRAFGWPFLLIVAALVLGAALYFATGLIYIRVIALPLGAGLVLFFIKLFELDS